MALLVGWVATRDGHSGSGSGIPGILAVPVPVPDYFEKSGSGSGCLIGRNKNRNTYRKNFNVLELIIREN